MVTPEQVSHVDLLRIPFLGAVLRWRWGRLLFQVALLCIAALMIYDGFTGPQLAARNTATVLSWVHYRGLIVLALLCFGNIFCFACPFTLTRTLTQRLSLFGNRWPRFLRTKWVAVLSLVIIFWLYEWLDLWASPWLTAWLILAYFALAFALETLFSESPFCKYVCPLGAYNFVYATSAPFQIRAREQAICRACPGKECLNGSEQVLGCGTELFVPTMQSNMDCILCLDCARACPYDNVALAARRPLQEWLQPAWPARWDLAFMVVSLTYFGLLNAFGMVPPVYALQIWLADGLKIQSEALQLLLIFAVGVLVLTSLTVGAASWLGARWSNQPARQLARRYSPAFVPLGLGIWMAHYGFHFAIGGLTIIPVLQSFFLDHGLTWLGTQPRWDLGFLLPVGWIFPLQILVILFGFAAGMYVLARRALDEEKDPRQGLLTLLPWALILVLVTMAALAVFNLPMEMRGAFRAA